jgi:hypothetical protein
MLMVMVFSSAEPRPARQLHDSHTSPRSSRVPPPMPTTICLHCCTPTTDHDHQCRVCGHFPGQLDCECECPACVGEPSYSVEWELERGPRAPARQSWRRA